MMASNAQLNIQIVTKTVVGPVKPDARRVFYTIRESTESSKPRAWYNFLSSSSTITTKRTAPGVHTRYCDSRIQYIHNLCSEVASKVPPEGFVYLWDAEGIKELIVKLTDPDYTGLLDQLCPRHAASANGNRKLSGSMPKKEEDCCSVINLLAAIKIYLNSWYRLGNDFPKPESVTNAVMFTCTREQVEPLFLLINQLSCHYSDVGEARIAFEQYTSIKKARGEVKAIQDHGKIQECSLHTSAISSSDKSPDQESVSSVESIV